MVRATKLAALAAAAAAAAPAAVEGTSFKNDFMLLGHVRTDPVTDPNGLSAHVHSYYGAAASLRPDMTYDDLRAACGNSGNVEDNKSLYWHPTIYKHDPVNGRYHTVPIAFGSAYYVWRTGETTAFPDGFQMIARQSSGGKARVNFDCSGPSECERPDCSIPEGTEQCREVRAEEFSTLHECLPVTACAELEIKIVFPACWDGVRTTADDFMSHVAYAEGNWGDQPIGDRQGDAVEAECPSSHPIRIPEVQFYFRVFDYEGGHHVFSDGSSEVHADYFSGWDAKVLQRVLDECSNDSFAAMPDAFCEQQLRFRTPKQTGEAGDDENIVEKLRALQPNPPLDLQRTVSPEAITNVATLPGAGGGGTLLPADQVPDRRCSETPTGEDDGNGEVGDGSEPDEGESGEDTARSPCDDPGWTTKGSTCARSKIGGQCYRQETRADAEMLCASVGARLCSVAELRTRVARATGCQLDGKLVWASDDDCAGSLSRVAKGKHGRRAKCLGPAKKAGVRCCANTN